jgi:hypothetical protein
MSIPDEILPGPHRAGLSLPFPTPTRLIDMFPQTSHTEAVALVVRE